MHGAVDERNAQAQAGGGEEVARGEIVGAVDDDVVALDQALELLKKTPGARKAPKGVLVIVAPDGTWHRPFTTLELAALQSIYDPDDYAEAETDGVPFQMDGTSDSAHRERIGNAVPKKAAKAMAEEIGRAILLSRTGETFQRTPPCR